MSEGVILDTGPLVAYLAASDSHHNWAVQAFSSVPPVFWTCEAVLAESAHLLRTEPRAMRFIDRMLENEWLRIAFQFAPERKRIFELIERYHNVPMSLTDACLVRMAELMDNCRVMTIDSDFRFYRKHRRMRIQTIMPPN